MLRTTRVRQTRRVPTWSVRALALSALLVTAALSAQPSGVPSDQQAALFSRILAYDRNLKTRAGTQVTVGIIYKGGNSASKSVGDAMAAAFVPLKQRTIQGLPFEVASQPYSDAARLDQWVTAQSIDVIYVCPGLESAFAEIRSVSDQRKAAVLTADRQQVRQGFTIGVVIRDDRPGIVINLTSAKAIGMDLDPKLLQLAEVLH